MFGLIKVFEWFPEEKPFNNLTPLSVGTQLRNVHIQDWFPVFPERKNIDFSIFVFHHR
jgi:hypothetical protein